MKIRPATPNDLSQIINIYSDDPIIGGNEICSPETHDSYLKTFQSIDSDDNQLLLVAEDSGIITGTLQVTCLQYLIGSSIRVAIIEAMFVHPEHTNSGIGSMLIKEAEKWSQKKNCSRLKLTSKIERTKAHHFYEKLGFTNDDIAFKKTLG
jgi:GNAT superfamily N-acetyltransferase